MGLPGDSINPLLGVMGPGECIMASKLGEAWMPESLKLVFKGVEKVGMGEGRALEVMSKRLGVCRLR